MILQQDEDYTSNKLTANGQTNEADEEDDDEHDDDDKLPKRMLFRRCMSSLSLSLSPSPSFSLPVLSSRMIITNCCHRSKWPLVASKSIVARFQSAKAHFVLIGRGCDRAICYPSNLFLSTNCLQTCDRLIMPPFALLFPSRVHYVADRPVGKLPPFQFGLFNRSANSIRQVARSPKSDRKSVRFRCFRCNRYAFRFLFGCRYKHLNAKTFNVRPVAHWLRRISIKDLFSWLVINIVTNWSSRSSRSTLPRFHSSWATFNCFIKSPNCGSCVCVSVLVVDSANNKPKRRFGWTSFSDRTRRKHEHVRQIGRDALPWFAISG